MVGSVHGGGGGDGGSLGGEGGGGEEAMAVDGERWWRRRMAEGGGAPIPLAPQTPTVVFGGGMAATTSTQPPVFRNTGGCAYVFRNTGTWGLETSKCSSPSSMAGYLPRVGLKRGERDLRQRERASCRARGILIVAWGRQGYAHLDARKSWT